MPADLKAQAQAASDVDDIKWVAVSTLRHHKGTQTSSRSSCPEHIGPALTLSGFKESSDSQI